jgi:hypothetical protein
MWHFYTIYLLNNFKSRLLNYGKKTTASEKAVKTLTTTKQKYAYGTLREQKFRSSEVQKYASATLREQDKNSRIKQQWH